MGLASPPVLTCRPALYSNRFRNIRISFKKCYDQTLPENEGPRRAFEAGASERAREASIINIRNRLSNQPTGHYRVIGAPECFFWEIRWQVI